MRARSRLPAGGRRACRLWIYSVSAAARYCPSIRRIMPVASMLLFGLCVLPLLTGRLAFHSGSLHRCMVLQLAIHSHSHSHSHAWCLLPCILSSLCPVAALLRRFVDVALFRRIQLPQYLAALQRNAVDACCKSLDESECVEMNVVAAPPP